MTSNPRTALVTWLDTEHDRQLAFLQALTQIDTCTPPGDTREAAALVRDFLKAEGIGHWTEAPQESMPNLISSFTGPVAGPHLVLNGHLDVFPIGDRDKWSRDPLSGEVADGRVHGRGTVDMKCGTTALLFVHAYLHRLRDHLPGKVTLTIVSDEETGGRWGSEWLTTQCADEVLGDCVLNTEPSGLETLRIGEKAILWLQFQVKVPGGHSAYPHTSASATKIAADLIQALQEIEELQPEEPAVVSDALNQPDVEAAITQALGVGAPEVMRRVSVNIGMIEGGMAVNMLPDRCTLSVDFRLPVGIKRTQVMQKIDEIVARHPAVSYERLLRDGPEATCSDPTHPMVGHLQHNAASVVGLEPKTIISLGATDTRFWRAAGVPAFVYGCSPAGMGAANESVSIEAFHNIMKVHALAAFDYLTARVEV